MSFPKFHLAPTYEEFNILKLALLALVPETAVALLVIFFPPLN